MIETYKEKNESLELEDRTEKIIQKMLDESFIDRINTENLPLKLVSDLLPRRKPRVLIVEDDPDSLTLISRVFQKFNCEIYQSTSVDEAYLHINHNIPDVIVLDWTLNEDSGQDFIKLCEQKIERFHDMHQNFSFVQPKIITFTGKKNFQLKINDNNYFEHFDHWPKPFKYNEILDKTVDLIKFIDF